MGPRKAPEEAILVKNAGVVHEVVSHKIKVLKTGVHKALVPENEWLCGGPWRIQAMRGATGVVAVEHIGGLLWQWQPLTSGNSPRHIGTTRALEGILHSRDCSTVAVTIAALA
ncbi:hypothetical protein Peur_022139 [Populus x canadensis]